MVTTATRDRISGVIVVYGVVVVDDVVIGDCVLRGRDGVLVRVITRVAIPIWHIRLKNIVEVFKSLGRSKTSR